MFTGRYKELIISNYFDRPQCRVLWKSGGEVLLGYEFKSYRSAQLFITKIMGVVKK
jgi:hypothetical protein